MKSDTLHQPRRLVAALILFGWASSGVAADPAAEDQIEMLVVPRTAGAEAGQGSVLIEGRVAPVLERRSVEPGSWRIHLTVDEPLVNPATLQTLSARLLRDVDSLAALGSVTVTLRGTGRVVLAESADPDALAGALVELAQSADRAGEYFEARRELEVALRATHGPAERRRLLIDHFHRERELLDWQHQSLLEEALLESAPTWMTGDHEPGDGTNREPTVDGPLALWLVRDDLGANTLDFLTEGLRAALRDGETADRERLSRTDIDAEVELLEARLGTLDSSSREALAGSAALLSSTGAALVVTCGVCPQNPSKSPRLLPDATADDLAIQGAVLDGRPDTLARLGGTTRWSIRLPDDLPSGEYLAVNLADAFRRDGARTAWIAPTPPSALTVVRARRFLEGLETGTLSVDAGILGDLGGGGTLETLLDVDSLGRNGDPAGRLRVSMVQRTLDAVLDFELLFGGRPDLDKRQWLLRSPVRLGRDLDRIAVVVEDLERGTWGAAIAGELQQSLESDAAEPEQVQVADGGSAALPVTLRSGPATTPEPEGAPSRGALIGERPDRAGSGRDRPAVVQLVAPQRGPLTGRQKFSVLAATTAVRSVAFYLDDEEVARDDRAPFAATIDLGREATEHLVRAVAYSGSDLLLGSDEVRVNRPRTRSGLRLTSVAPHTEGTEPVLLAEAALGLEPDQQLERVEFYRNQALIATLTRPPLRAAVGAPPDADAAARGDFVRVVAWLEDGTFLEDVRLLGLGGSSAVGEQVEVNLVQIFAVVTDTDGNPIEDLEVDAFDVRLDSDEVALERFSKAEQVPLDLALVVDTSTSMWPLMDDTRKAAARFLGQTVSAQDRAMLIDFDDRVRTVHPLSTEVFSLIEGLSRLRASGATALYDSIIYALVALEEAARSRRAVVLLTDGSDFNSRFGYGRVYESAESAGVPLYFIALSDYFGESRRSPRKTDLEAFAEASGGRVFYVKSMEDILTAYERISRELRSQYLLTFTTERELSRDELDKLRVGLSDDVANRRRLEVRWTVGWSR